MEKKAKFLLLFLLIVSLGIISMAIVQNYDIKGFSLSEREAILANAGNNHSFLFELREGDYEFKLYRFQNGNLIEEHFFSGGGFIHEDDVKPNILQVQQNSNFITVTATDFEEGTWAWSLGTEKLNLGKGITVTEVDGLSRSWGSIEKGLSLENTETPLLYIAFSDGSFPTALQNIVTGLSFDIYEDVYQFTDIVDLFIVTITKIN